MFAGQAGRYYKEPSCYRAEHYAKNTRAKTANQRYDQNGGNELNVHDIWINGEQQRCGNRSGHKSERIIADGSGRSLAKST